MALNKKQKEIRDRKVGEMSEEIEKRQDVITRSLISHEDGMAKLEEELELEVLVRDALKSLK